TAPTTSAEGHLARFDAPKPELHTASESALAQPFLRCMHCEGDNNRYATGCMHCHADLATPEQRAFNERLWAQLLAQREEEEKAHAAHQAAFLQAAIEEKEARRRAAEALAREVGARTRARLNADEGWTFGTRFGRRRAMHAYMAENPRVAAAVVALLAFANLFVPRPPLWRYGPFAVVALVAIVWAVKRFREKKER
ncbi:MAG: hypothetical protein IRZ16_15970, partial [Myxococcaceae bacterium]|nr:hypothetical protein [Myxococcaceae bacterium]